MDASPAFDVIIVKFELPLDDYPVVFLCSRQRQRAQRGSSATVRIRSARGMRLAVTTIFESELHEKVVAQTNHTFDSRGFRRSKHH